MFSNNFVATIKVNGSVLRESAGQVSVPFGSEYSVYLKNLSSVRALVKVSIDDTDVTEGTELIIQPNSHLDLERFIRNGNWNKGNRFKFIKRTGKIEETRGIKGEDGLVRIEYRFEKPYVAPEVKHTYHHHHHGYYHNPYWWGYYPYYGTIYNNCNTITSGAIGEAVTYRSSNAGGSSGNVSDVFEVSESSVNNNVSFTNSSMSGGKSLLRSAQAKGGISGQSRSIHAMNFMDSSPAPAAEPGITVAGSESDQKFVTGAWFPTEEQSHVIILKLVGTVGGKAIQQPITVKTKAKCTTCSTVNKSGVKFCRECGTALEII